MSRSGRSACPLAGVAPGVCAAGRGGVDSTAHRSEERNRCLGFMAHDEALLIELAIAAQTDLDARQVLRDVVLGREWAPLSKIGRCRNGRRVSRARWFEWVARGRQQWWRVTLAVLLFGGWSIYRWPLANPFYFWSHITFTFDGELVTMPVTHLRVTYS